MVAENDPSEIRIERTYDAPVALVWEAWTDPRHVAQWWGPRGFTLTTHAKELRPGGVWWYTMHGPDGVDYPNKTLYHEVQVERKLVYDHGGNDDRPPLFRVTVLFDETDGRTTMRMTMRLPTPEQAEATRRLIREVGGHSTWDRLAEFLAETFAGRSSFVIHRSLAAPRETVFGFWTDAALQQRWLPPTGFSMEVLRGEIGVGQSLLVRMSKPGDISFCCRFDYRVIEPHRRLVYDQRFCTEHEAPAKHPGLQTFPDALRTTVEFADEPFGTTRVAVTSEPIGPVTADETAAFRETRGGMTLGWTGSFDRLETLSSGRVD